MKMKILFIMLFLVSLIAIAGCSSQISSPTESDQSCKNTIMTLLKCRSDFKDCSIPYCSQPQKDSQERLECIVNCVMQRQSCEKGVLNQYVLNQ